MLKSSKWYDRNGQTYYWTITIIAQRAVKTSNATKLDYTVTILVVEWNSKELQPDHYENLREIWCQNSIAIDREKNS